MGEGGPLPADSKRNELMKLNTPRSLRHSVHGSYAGRADLGFLVATLREGCSLRDWVDVPVVAAVCRRAQAQSAAATRQGVATPAAAASISHTVHQHTAVQSLIAEKQHQHMSSMVVSTCQVC